jgi:hypothetical protein
VVATVGVETGAGVVTSDSPPVHAAPVNANNPAMHSAGAMRIRGQRDTGAESYASWSRMSAIRSLRERSSSAGGGGATWV